MSEATLVSPQATSAATRPGFAASLFGSPYLTRESVSEPAMPAPNAAAAEAAEGRRLVASGDQPFARELYERYVDRIHRLALRMTGNAAMAEDLTQDVFVRAFQRLDQFRGESQPGTWLHRVAISVILNAVRKRQVMTPRELPLLETQPAATNSGAIELDVRDRVRAAVAQLPEELRVVVLLFDVEGYTHNEVAEMVGISSGACRMRLLRARQLLRSMLPLEQEEWGS
jgi:RNA polymerase sigma-70 factor, ECF subfamily